MEKITAKKIGKRNTKITKTDARKIITESDGMLLLGLIMDEEKSEFTLKTLVFNLSEIELATAIISFLTDNPVILNTLKEYLKRSEEEESGTSETLLDHPSLFEQGN
jgi:hypothetical protein